MPKNNSYNKVEYIGKQRLRKLGDKNPSWKGGNSYHYQSRFYKKIALDLKQKCSMCGTKYKLVVHHIDGNYKNNILSNICIVCKGCHNKIHKSKIGMGK